MTHNWHVVWNRRGSETAGQALNDPLQALIDLDGFDSGAGRILAADWRTYANLIIQRLNVRPGQSVYEVGCGAGAFLFALREQGVQVGGIDYAENLVLQSRKVMPEASFHHGEAVQLVVEPRVDFVFANGVFHYFRDEDYAAQVLERMLAKATKGIAVLEVPDLASCDEAERIRRDLLTPSAYEEKYRGLEHLYYSREWFRQLAERRGYRCELFGQCVPNYAQSSFRFNCLIIK